jgi:hypothetical protein
MEEEEYIKELEEIYNQLEKERLLLHGVISNLSHLQTKVKEVIALIVVKTSGDD